MFLLGWLLRRNWPKAPALRRKDLLFLRGVSLLLLLWQVGLRLLMFLVLVSFFFFVQLIDLFSGILFQGLFWFCAGASDPSITGWTDALREVHSLVGGSFFGLRRLVFGPYDFFLTYFCFADRFRQKLRSMDFDTLLRVQFEHHSLVRF